MRKNDVHKFLPGLSPRLAILSWTSCDIKVMLSGSHSGEISETISTLLLLDKARTPKSASGIGDLGGDISVKQDYQVKMTYQVKRCKIWFRSMPFTYRFCIIIIKTKISNLQSHQENVVISLLTDL